MTYQAMLTAVFHAWGDLEGPGDVRCTWMRDAWSGKELWREMAREEVAERDGRSEGVRVTERGDMEPSIRGRRRQGSER